MDSCIVPADCTALYVGLPLDQLPPWIQSAVHVRYGLHCCTSRMCVQQLGLVQFRSLQETPAPYFVILRMSGSQHQLDVCRWRSVRPPFADFRAPMMLPIHR